MKLKNNFSIEIAAEKLKSELSSHISVKICSNIVNRNYKWLEIEKDMFVGVKVYFFENQIKSVGIVPNFFARMMFGGLGRLFHLGSRSKFQKQIEDFLIDEFYVNDI